MTRIDFNDGTAVLVRAAEAEVIGFAPQTVRLLADSSSTGGRLSTQWVTLLGGADGASPHHHANSAELFYVLSGSVQLLAGDRVHVAGEGDLAVVPPGLPHAFAAAPASDTDLLIVITPGVERFEYFRHMARIAAGQPPADSLLDVQALYDTFFDHSPAWRQTRGGDQPDSYPVHPAPRRDLVACRLPRRGGPAGHPRRPGSDVGTPLAVQPGALDRAGPLAWTPSLDGPRLTGRHLPSPDESQAAHRP